MTFKPSELNNKNIQFNTNGSENVIYLCTHLYNAYTVKNSDIFLDKAKND